MLSILASSVLWAVGIKVSLATLASPPFSLNPDWFLLSWIQTVNPSYEILLHFEILFVAVILYNTIPSENLMIQHINMSTGIDLILLFGFCSLVWFRLGITTWLRFGWDCAINKNTPLHNISGDLRITLTLCD